MLYGESWTGLQKLKQALDPDDLFGNPIGQTGFRAE